MPEKPQKTIEDLRAEVAEAKNREDELAEEATELPGKIAAAAREDVKAKARQARETGNVAMATLASEVPMLEERMGTIRYERWAARLHRAELEKQLHDAEEKAAREEIPAARARLNQALDALEDAERARNDAAAAYRRAEGREMEARRKRRLAEQEITELEAEYPDA